MTDDQIKHMVNRFLGWRLPENFRPDAGISFKAEFNEHTKHPMKHEPIGTNLLDWNQAEVMVRYLVDGLPAQGRDISAAAHRLMVADDSTLDLIVARDPDMIRDVAAALASKS